MTNTNTTTASNSIANEDFPENFQWKDLVGTIFRQKDPEYYRNKYNNLPLNEIPLVGDIIRKELSMYFLFNKIPERQIENINIRIDQLISLEKRRVQK